MMLEIKTFYHNKNHQKAFMLIIQALKLDKNIFDKIFKSPQQIRYQPINRVPVTLKTTTAVGGTLWPLKLCCDAPYAFRPEQCCATEL